MTPKILLVEDDNNLGEALEKYLSKEGCEVVRAKNLGEASEQSLQEKDIVILDWMLPDGQGIDWLEKIRTQGHLLPVIMLTARNELIDKVVGLERGANDYMTKPFEPRELMARIRVQLRAAKVVPAEEQESEIVRKELVISPETREVKYRDQLIELTKMEFNLLQLLAEKPGRAFSREEILNKVWGFENYPTTRTVDTHVLQLRQKFEDEMIETVRGIGYRFNKTYAD